MPTLLIIGGTGEARRLANAAAAAYGASLRLVTARAGLVEPVGPLAGEVRRGGFGGVDGLAEYLNHEAVDWVIDASHPFAVTISEHARTACRRAARDYLRLDRPAWRPPPGGRWRRCAGPAALCRVLPGGAGRILLTLGAKGTDGFAAAYRTRRLDMKGPVPVRDWLIRVAVEPGRDRLADWVTAFGPLLSPAAMRLRLHRRRAGRRGGRQGGFALLVRRGPFPFAPEAALLRQFRVDCLIAKMSGGAATRAKLAAADRLGLPSLLLRRPPSGGGERAGGITAALDWLERRYPPP